MILQNSEDWDDRTADSTRPDSDSFSWEEGPFQYMNSKPTCYPPAENVSTLLMPSDSGGDLD